MADKDSRAGARYADEAIRDYLDRVHAGHDAGLDAAFSAPGRENMPAIQVGQSEGRMIELLVRLALPERSPREPDTGSGRMTPWASGGRRAVELGTLAGYSAIRLARALGPEGHLWSVELEPHHAEVARKNLALAGVADRVSVLLGKGADVLPTIEEHGPFDAVFIDADKASYDLYGRWAAANLRPGGLLLGDNAYLFGNLMDDTPTAAAMRRFHEEAAQAFDTVCIPTPDGLLLGIKK